MRGRGGSAGSAGLARGLAILLVGGAILLALAVDEGLGEPVDDPAFAAESAADESLVGVPPAGTLSAAWYCAEGTSSGGGRADEIVAIANSREVPVDAQITVLRGREQSPVRHQVEVPARSRERVRIADIVETPEPGVVVEVFGGGAAVEHELRGANGDHAVLPCAREPAGRWLFPGGATVKDARDVLALLNPFAEDAVVDMTFFTEDGVERPVALQGFVVPGRSRVTVPVHEHVLRKERVAAEIVVRSGRIAAERSIRWDGSTDRRGLAVFGGVQAPAETWWFPEGLVRERVAEDIWVLNPAEVGTVVEIQPHLDGDRVAAPLEVDVPARSAVSVRLDDAVPEGVGHGLAVTAVGDADVVVAQELTALTGATRPGSSVAVGIRETARRWLFPSGAADDRVDEWIVALNPGTKPVSMRVSVLAGGLLLVPEGLGDLEVEPGRRRPVRLGDALERSDLPIVVEADGPLAVSRGLFTETAVSLGPGVPYLADGDGSGG